jgi:diguanylate cyclase (GGDEF)-like protein/PAS domain S-box-containing protein
MLGSHSVTGDHIELDHMATGIMNSQVRRIVLSQIVFFLLALGMIWWSHRAADVAEAWFANAWLVAVLARRWVRSLSWTLVAGGISIAVANIVTGTSAGISVGFGVANMAEVAVAVLLIRQLGLSLAGAAPDRTFFLGMLSSVVLAPGIGSLIGSTVAWQAMGLSWPRTFQDWWVGDAAGMLALLPPLLTYSPRQLRSLVAGKRAAAFWIALVASVAMTTWATGYLQRPFIIWSIPLLIAAYRLGVFGTTLLCSLNIATVFVMAAGQVNGWWGESPGLAGLHAGELTFFAASSVVGPLLISLVIAQRRRTSRALAETSYRLRVVTDNVPALIAQLDRNSRYLFINKKYLEWYGLDAKSVIGRTPAEVFGEEMASRLAPRIDRVLAGESQVFDITMPNGQRMEARYEPHVEAGQITGFYVMAQDISDRYELEARLAEITDNVPAMIAYLDRELVYRYVNERYAVLWRRDPIQIVGHSSREIAGERYTEQLRPKQLRCLDGQRTSIELALDDGRTFDITYVPHIVDGKVRGIYKLGVDITERKHIESMLFESLDRTQRMLDSIGDAVVSCDTNLRITMMNPVAVSMTGWEESDAIGEPFENVVELIDIESGEKTLNPVEIAMREKRIVALQANSALRRRDGMTSPIEDSAAPIHDNNGEVVGGIMVFHDVSESRAMALKMSHLAQHDYLTDLPNRVLFQDRLAHALESLRRGTIGAVMFVDLDHFKNINDSLGHQAGDHVLKVVAERLSGAVRPDDTVSRQGGDEFVILLNRLADPSDAARVAEKIIGSLEKGVELDGRQMHLSASVGIAMYPEDSADAKTLLKQADTALYHAKQAGRGRFSYFAESMSERAEQRLALEHALREALRNEEFVLVYQPKVHWPSGEVVGTEALVRWRRPNGEVVPPDRFVPLAEETGLINQVDEWVMREACRQTREWRQAGHPPLPVSVNLSLARLDAEQLLDTVRSVLADENVPSGCLQIEFTESQMFAHMDEVRELLVELKSMGVGLVIDDFGTGYSSLSYLARYNFDIIKIDRAFVRGIPSNHKQYAIVQAIIGMARALGYHMVAEGVETREEASTLVRNGCHEMQGFLFSAPLSASAMEALMRDGAKIQLPQPSPAADMFPASLVDPRQD